MVHDKIIMVLDDEPGVALFCQAALERAGYAVIVQQDARQALGVLQTARVDLLLLDIRMPHLDGFQVMERARLVQPDLAVLIMTGYGTLDTAMRALKTGANGLIFKPFETTQELLDDVARAFRERDQAREMVRLRSLSPLLTITQSLFSQTDRDTLIEQALDSVTQLLNCDHAGFYQRRQHPDGQPEDLELRNARGRPLPGEPCSFNGGPVARADAWSATVQVGADQPDDPDLLASIRAHDLGAVLCAPAARGGGAGSSVLLAGRGLDGQPFSEADHELFSILASQVGAALQNAQLYADLLASLERQRAQQQALLQTEKMAAIGRLTASIAHEVNNPLQAVRNCLHLVNHPDLPAEKRDQYLVLAQEELQRLMDTVQQMLDFYRPGPRQREPVDINALIGTVLSLLDRQLEQSQVQVETSFAGGLPQLVVVRNQIQQVFFNILLNAMEAMPGGGLVRIETLRVDRQVVVTVADNGPGIPQEARQRLFEPFVSAKPQGTGLGLSISYTILDAHGGTLELVDSPPPGAIFRISLPIPEVR